MRNKDRFSGTMLNPRIIVRTDYMTQTCQPDKINRIIFSADNDREVTVQLTNGDIIQAEYFPGLDAVIAVLEKNPDLKLEIQGHTDDVGSPDFNQKLSAKRARAAKRYMQDKGMAPARLSLRGYGATRSQASNETAAGRALNRRVKIAPRNKDERRTSN